LDPLNSILFAICWLRVVADYRGFGNVNNPFYGAYDYDEAFDCFAECALRLGPRFVLGLFQEDERSEM
jgi:hypothetical protein